jgi:hypothetical protein
MKVKTKMQSGSTKWKILNWLPKRGNWGHTLDVKLGRAIAFAAEIDGSARVKARVPRGDALNDQETCLLSDIDCGRLGGAHFKAVEQPRKRNGVVTLGGNASQLNVFALTAIFRGKGQGQERRNFCESTTGGATF